MLIKKSRMSLLVLISAGTVENILEVLIEEKLIVLI
jgi:hypothetical protein